MTMTAAGKDVVRIGPTTPGPWRSELSAAVRAVSGGLLFGVPLLYTMEVWWTGERSTPAQTAVVLVLLFGPVFALNRTGGFRTSRDVRLRDAAADTVETVAIGIVVTAVVLVLLRQLSVSTPPGVVVGMIVYESVPFCLGAAVARHFLHGTRDRGDDEDGATTANRRHPDELDGTVADVGATAIGAVFVSLSIAPTDEVPMIASTMDPVWVLVFVAASLLISYAIVFAAGFAGQERRHAQEGVLQRPITETIACYLVALVVAAVMLWLFQRGLSPWSDALTRVVVLGLPATVGGAAGRLAL